MQEELRKVMFVLDEQNLTIGDLGFEDAEGVAKKRHGYFHRFGDSIVYDAEQERNWPKTIAIVEEIGTGAVYEVAPRCIAFE